MSKLNEEQMNKLTTPRLIAYQKKQRSNLGKYFCDDTGFIIKDLEEEYEELTKHSGHIKYLLLQREDYKSTKSVGKIKKEKHDIKSTNKGCQSLNKSKKKRKNK